MKISTTLEFKSTAGLGNSSGHRLRRRGVAQGVWALLFAGLVASAVGASDELIISEFMAKNTNTIADADGGFSDWIEIQNVGTNTVDLLGWYLTDKDSNLTKWKFPSTLIAPGQFVLVWASEKNRRVSGEPLHTNFKLSDEGEYLGLVQSNGTTVVSQFAPTFPPQFSDLSYGRVLGATTNSFLAWPTPLATNSPGTNFVVATLSFDPGSC